MDNTYLVRVSFDLVFQTDFKLEDFPFLNQWAILDQLLFLVGRDFKKDGYELKNARVDGYRYEWEDLLTELRRKIEEASEKNG